MVQATFLSWFCPPVCFIILTYHLLPWASVSLLKPGIPPFRLQPRKRSLQRGLAANYPAELVEGQAPRGRWCSPAE